jgi:hypothetical protein
LRIQESFHRIAPSTSRAGMVIHRFASRRLIPLSLPDRHIAGTCLTHSAPTYRLLLDEWHELLIVRIRADDIGRHC